MLHRLCSLHATIRHRAGNFVFFSQSTSVFQNRFLPAMSQASEAHLLDPPSTKTGLKPELLLSLPDVPTLAILSLLPLRQLIVIVPLVHPRLAPFRQSVLKSVQRLVLHIGYQNAIKNLQFHSPLRLPFASHLVDSTGALLYPETDFYTLSLEDLDDYSVGQLSSLLPAIAHLQVVISYAPIGVLPQLDLLLKHWAPTLQTLQLTIGNIGNYPSNKNSFLERPFFLGERKPAFSTIVPYLRALIQAINDNFKALQTLTLDIGKVLYQNLDEIIFGGETDVPLGLSILGQLRGFNLNLGDCPRAPSFLLEQLEAHATENLNTIGLGGDFNWNWSEMAKSPFAARFTIVPISSSSTSHDASFFQSFSNLTVYEFNWRKLNALELVALFRRLSTLPQLQFLKVNSFSPVSHPLPDSFTDLPSLRSVTVLEITLFLEANEGHDHLQAPYWSTLFPSVQIVKVKHIGRFCAICYPGEGWGSAVVRTNYAEMTPCLRQLFAPLAVLPSLRKIFHQRDGRSYKGCIAEFTPQGEFVRTHEFIG